MNRASLAVGQKIELNDGRVAVVRFVGTTSFQTGDWVGVELEEPTGKNDGSVKGQRYFDVEQNYGMFLRPAGVRQVLEDVKAKPKTAANGTAARSSRQSVAGVGTNALKRQSLQSTAASPTPSSRLGGPSGRGSPSKSPTKPIAGNGSSSAATSRTNTPTTAAKRPTAAPATASAKARPGIGPSNTSASRRTSTVPSSATTSTSRAPRQSLAPPTTGTSRTLVSSKSPPSQRPDVVDRLSLDQRQDSESKDASGGMNDDQEEGEDAEEDRQSPATRSIKGEEPTHLDEVQEADGAQEGEELAKFNFAPPPEPPPEPQRRQTLSRRTSSPPASVHSQRTARSAATSKKQIEELEAQLRLMERKRLEDKELKQQLDRVQQERDKYQSIIEKLQTKYQPQQQEIAELKKAMNESEKNQVDIEALQAEHDSIMEMATLDREMAEETAETLKTELEALRSKNEEMELELEVLREENGELSKEMSPEERTSTGWLQMEKSNERLREALLRLRDMTHEQEAELKDQIKNLEAQIKEFDEYKTGFEETKEKLLRTEADAEDLRQQLEAALGAEDMIEELTERNMAMQENLGQLRGTIEDLENLKELNDELEINHVEAEKQMQDEIDFKESLLLDRERTAKQQQEALDDADYTIRRFRELVSTLQSDLQDMQASKQISETEAEDLNSKSRAMLDLNMKLQNSAAKTQVKTIDLELRKLEAQEASEHLAIVQLFLPDAFHAERDSVLALLRFKRVGFKANLVHGFVKERIASFGARGLDENVFAACGVLDKLVWVSGMANRFINSICGCSADEFASYEGALYELEPVERALNGYIDGLRREEVKEKAMNEELQRSMAVMSHLATSHLHGELAIHADDLLMRSACLESQLENTASALSVLKMLMERHISLPTKGEEDEADGRDDDESASDHKMLLSRADALISHVRSARVVAAKAHRAIADLQDRSLTLEKNCTATFESVEALATQVASFAKEAGDAVQILVTEDSRNEPLPSSEVASSLSRSASAAFSLPTPEAGPFNTLATRLRELTDVLADLASLPSDLDNAIEFERGPAPWVARADKLRQTKLISIDTEAELTRTLETVKQRDLVVREKNTELEEQSVRIEMLEARMKDASKRSAKIAELEAALHAAEDNEKTAKTELARSQREAQHDLQRVRDEMSRLADERAKRGGDHGHDELEHGAMGPGARLKLQTQDYTIASLRGALRYLHAENHALRLPAPDAPHAVAANLDWLREPLFPKHKSTRWKQREGLKHEGQRVLHRVLEMAVDGGEGVVDLTRLPDNRLAWRPARETARWRISRRREEWEVWREWRRDVLGRAKGGC
ncbi:hypothetical protein MBLNU230_g8302t1 [Neophaeotheca triangularis]